MNTSLQNRIGWVDMLRVVACVMMVVSHCCDGFVSQFDANRHEFLSGAFIGSMMRACVPMFVMLSGVLLLPVRLQLGAFYRKRISRVVIALVFWSIILPLAYFIYLHYIPTSNPGVALADFTWSETVPKLWSFIFNFNYATTPLWYLYMLVGLYLIMPILSAWLDRASKKDLLTVLSIWGISLLLPYFKLVAPMLGYAGNYGNMNTLGVCDWNEFGMFYYLSGFAGYLLLGHYLVKYPLAWSLKKRLAVCLPIFGLGYAITALGFIVTQKYFPGSYANLEVIWYFSGINVALMTASLFIIAQSFNIRPTSWLTRLSGAAFGVYLCHFIVVQGAYDLIGGLAIPAPFRIALMVLFASLVSYAIVRAMQAVPFLRRFVE